MSVTENSGDNGNNDFLKVSDEIPVGDKVDSKPTEDTSKPHSFLLDPILPDESVSETAWLSTKTNSENSLPQELQDKCHGKKKLKKLLKREARASLIKEKNRVSDSELVTNKLNLTRGLTKILFWDPWNKLGRKNKKDKKNKYPVDTDSSEASVINFPNTTILDDKPFDESHVEIYTEPQGEDKKEHYEHFHKTVRFRQDVEVIHFNGEKVIGKTIEPLKKESEQQERNRELRKDVIQESLQGQKPKKK